MEREKKRNKKKILTIAYLLLSVAFAAIICYICYFLTKNKVETTQDFVEGEEDKIRFAITSRLLVTKTLEIDVITHDGKILDFEEVAAFLCDEDPTIRSIQLAPDGVVTYVYPEEDNEGAFIDLFADPDRKADAELARDSRKIVLSGPYELSQGGLGLVVRNPVYLKESDGGRNFWGFSIAVLNVPDIFEDAELDLFDTQEYDYRLWRKIPGSDETQVILENTDKKLSNAIQEEIKVPNAVWYLDIAPKGKWVSRPLLFLLIATSSIIIFLSMLALSSHLTVLEQREELIRQNNTDGLTGIKNGRYFMRRVRELADEQTACAVFYLDLNDFKEINDSYGHEEGDKILCEVAKRIQSCIRETDIAARLGGDEFAVIVTSDETERYCADLQDRIRKKVAEPYTVEGITLHPSISAGFARYPYDSGEIENIMRIADKRMYKGKHQMKGRK